MSDIYEWGLANNQNSADPPDGFPERRMEFEDFNDGMREVMAALRRHYDDRSLTATDAGTNALEISSTAQDLTEFTPGFIVGFKTPASFENTGPTTLKVGSLDALPLVHPDGSVLAPNILREEAWYLAVARHDRLAWQLFSNQEVPSRDPLIRYIGTGGDSTILTTDVGNQIEISPIGGSARLVIPDDYADFWPIGAGASLTVFELNGSQISVDPPAGVLLRVNRAGTVAGAPRVVLATRSVEQCRIFRLYRSGLSSFSAWTSRI